MKIAFYGLEKGQKEIVQEELKDKLYFFPGKLKSNNIQKDVEAISIFVHSPVDAKMLEKMPKLKLITTRSTGFDHIDLEACRKRKITVCNVPAYGEETVAEHTFALILGLSRKLVECAERTEKGSFELKGLRGFDLQGKKIGVVGCGKIGQHVIRIAKGFEMEVLVFDVNKDLKLSKKLGFRYVSMDKLISDSDIVTLHVPLNKHTFHLIDAKAISKMKKGAYLINTSRGGVVDTDALVKDLKKGKLGGAGLDVLEEECEMKEEAELLSKHFECDLKTLVENHVLMEMPNVIVTPHNAFNTHEAVMRILTTTIDNIKAFKKGRKVNVIG